ncbi:MAG: Nif3-like dinuclear metal center hexameric protein [Saccharofermentanales bacterium]
MKLSEIVQTIERLAPLHLAMDWDNVGLLAGDPDSEVESIVLCLDITEAAYELCMSTQADLCICHHPFLFDPIRRIDYSNPQQRLLGKMLKAGIAIYAAHTNLDACEGGVNDELAKTIGLTVLQKQAGQASRNPVEVIPGEASGIWRICSAGPGVSLFGLYKNVTVELKVPGCHINFDTDRPVGKIIILGGSYDSKWNAEAIQSGADTIICGEMKYHDMVYFAGSGVAVIAAGHDATERIIVPALADYLQKKYPQILFAVCKGLDYNRVVF